MQDVPGAVGVDALDLAELEDSTLMARVAEGTPAALEVLYDRYANLIYSFAMRMLGEPEAARELVQEVFLRVWQRAASYEPRRGTFANWLLSLTHNLGVEEVRRRRSRPQLADGAMSGDDDDRLDGSPDLKAGTELDAWAAVRRRHIREALQVLTGDQRRALELSYFHGYTQDEIARLTGEPLSTIKSRMRLSLRKLREVLHPDEVEVEL